MSMEFLFVRFIDKSFYNLLKRKNIRELCPLTASAPIFSTCHACFRAQTEASVKTENAPP